MGASGARNALATGEADLCQFDFANGGMAGVDWSMWRLPIALAVLLVVVQLVGMNARWLTLRAEQKRLDAAMRTQLQTAFPNTPVILDPPAQMRRQVEQLRLAAGKSAPEDFLPLADRFAQAATGLAPDALLALDYHGRALTVTLKDGTDTNALRTAARNLSRGAAGVVLFETGTVAVPTADGRAPSLAPQYGKADIFNPGFAGRGRARQVGNGRSSECAEQQGQ